jgi:hypothetical protein
MNTMCEGYEIPEKVVPNKKLVEKKNNKKKSL